MSNEKSPVRERITPAVPFVLTVIDENGDKFEQHLRLSYDLNALSLVEERLGKSLLTQVLDVLTDFSVKAVSILLWAALQENHFDWYGGEVGLYRLRKNLTLPAVKAAHAACMETYLSQLPKDSAERIRKALNGEKVGDPQQPEPAAAK